MSRATLSWGRNQVSEFPGWGMRRTLERRAAACHAADITPWDILKEAESLWIELAMTTQISQLGARVHANLCLHLTLVDCMFGVILGLSKTWSGRSRYSFLVLELSVPSERYF